MPKLALKPSVWLTVSNGILLREIEVVEVRERRAIETKDGERGNRLDPSLNMMCAARGGGRIMRVISVRPSLSTVPDIFGEPFEHLERNVSVVPGYSAAEIVRDLRLRLSFSGLSSLF